MTGWFACRAWFERRHPVLLAVVTVLAGIVALLVLLGAPAQVILYEAF